MLPMREQELLDVVLDSWDRNNSILVSFFKALPEGGLKVRPMEGSPSVWESFAHIVYVRLVFVSEDAPEFAEAVPSKEWMAECDATELLGQLNKSARVVREAVRSNVEAREEMKVHYDHPILLLQHMIWHEGYHHGQMKLALKLAGMPMKNSEAGPITWRVWMNKSS